MTDPVSQLAAEGQHDSSGKFTLDVLAARRKLSKLSQAQPGLMLGKLVQAAVAGQAHGVDFIIGSSHISARLDFDYKAANQELKLSNCPAGCTVIRAVSQLGVDLDQLNLVQDDDFREMERELATLLERCLARWKG